MVSLTRQPRCNPPPPPRKIKIFCCSFICALSLADILTSTACYRDSFTLLVLHNLQFSFSFTSACFLSVVCFLCTCHYSASMLFHLLFAASLVYRCKRQILGNSHYGSQVLHDVTRAKKFVLVEYPHQGGTKCVGNELRYSFFFVLYSLCVVCPLLFVWFSVLCFVWALRVILCDMCCLIVVPLHQGKIQFAVQLRNNYRMRLTPPAGITKGQLTCLWWIIRLVNPAWISLPSGLPLPNRKLTTHSSVHFNIIKENLECCVFMLILCTCSVCLIIAGTFLSAVRFLFISVLCTRPDYIYSPFLTIQGF
jgi:hypothetical protein